MALHKNSVFSYRASYAKTRIRHESVDKMTSIGIYFSDAGVQCRTQCQVAFVVVVVVVVVVDLKFGRVLGDDRLDSV